MLSAEDWWTRLSIDQWAATYRVAMVVLALSYLFRSILFLVLHPKGRMEWATFWASATLMAVFVTLSYWHFVISSAAIRPAVYAPLVVAFCSAAVASVWFTYIAWCDWLGRRRGATYGGYERFVLVALVLMTMIAWLLLMAVSRSHG